MSLHRTLVTQCRLFDSCTTHGRRILSQCVYQILSKQVRRAAAWRLPLTFSFFAPWSSSRMAHAPRLWAKLTPLRPIFRRKLFFIALDTLRLRPVWPRPHGPGFQDVSPKFLLPVRGQRWDQAFENSRSQLPPPPPHRARAFIPSLECCQVVHHFKCTPFVSNFRGSAQSLPCPSGIFCQTC